MPDELRKVAQGLYTGPFTHDNGYIFDAKGEMVLDDCGEDETKIARVRGWGRISKLADAEGVQDAVGDLVAELLTKHWANINRVPEWHAPGLGEVHNRDHTKIIFCADSDGIASDDIARDVAAALNK